MKLLFLVQAEQRAILDRLYQGVAEGCESCDLRWLTSAQQADLKKYFKNHVDVGSYDRILLFLRFKKEIKQWRFLRSLPNLVFLEHDAYQNYIDCKYKGKFSRQYGRMPWVRVINSGATVVKRLREEGFDAHFVAKGYDQYLISYQEGERDIELAFIGSIKGSAYNGRKAFLEELSKVEDVLITRTNSGEEYCKALNRVRFFVSADVGMGEYMIKNFEAMACGCVLLAYDQGLYENQALGLRDMENVVLYHSLDDFRRKLEKLRADPALADSIAYNGRILAEQNYSYLSVGNRVAEILSKPLRKTKYKKSFFYSLFGGLI